MVPAVGRDVEQDQKPIADELVRVTRARMEGAQAAIYAAERRAGEAERLAKDAEEKAKTSRECLTWVRERALSQSGETCHTARGETRITRGVDPG
jgi:hypothetical protein